MIRITHPRPQLGRQKDLGVEFIDGVAEVEELHPERQLALVQHGYGVELVGIRLEDLTVPELREIADQEGVDLPAKAKKPAIIKALDAAVPTAIIEET